MLKVKEVAERLGLSPRTIFDKVARGDFDGVAFRFGRSLRFDEAKLAEWIEAQRVGGQS